MKRFSRIIWGSVAVYLVIAAVSGLLLYQAGKESDKVYKVEINRICHIFSGDIRELDMEAYEYVQEVKYLEAGSSEEEVRTFFHVSGFYSVEIQPWYQDGSLKGYLRFEYTNPNRSTWYEILINEAALLGMEICILGILIYLRERLVKPFYKMSHMPDELARGHLNGEIREESGKYLGDFLQGVGRLKDTLAVTKKRELELAREKKTMLLSLAHDIKTPLNTIKLYAKALTDKLYTTEKEEKEAALQIGRKAEEIEKYVEDIMQASREDILDIRVEDGEFYLGDLMEKILGVYREKCDLRMTKLVVGEYENCLLRGDIERSCEVLENILENAFKYGDGKKIEITFSQEEYCRLIHIYNTGEPVSDNDINHIFESFFRGTGSSGQQGNGLGLYICREIMHKMGGEIYAEKAPGGMCFVLVFT